MNTMLSDNMILLLWAFVMVVIVFAINKRFAKRDHFNNLRAAKARYGLFGDIVGDVVKLAASEIQTEENYDG